MRLSPASFLILIAFLLLPLQLAKADEVFEKWLSDLRADALAAGISEQTVATALSNVELREKVVKYDRNQPEFKLTYERYMRNVVPASRVQEGKQKWADNEALLKEIGDHFGVQPRYIVALWGIESSFGRHTGGFSVINALASLAYDGRRAKFFRKELLSALLKLIVVSNHLPRSQSGGHEQGKRMRASSRSRQRAEALDSKGKLA